MSLFGGEFGRWQVVTRCDARARLLADRHYSRQTPGAQEFMANGKTLVMITEDGRAVWGAIENRPPNPPGAAPRWRVSIFRNEGAGLSSDLIREATDKTLEYWSRHYGGTPRAPLTTEINPEKVRHKRDPGRCFRKAGWFEVPWGKDLVVLVAPFESTRQGLFEGCPF